MAPLEAEQLVTIPIESIMNGLPDVTQVRSMSKFGLSVTVVFKDNVDIYFARQVVFERLQNARGRSPKDIEPELGPVATAMGEIYHYVLESDSFQSDRSEKIARLEINYTTLSPRRGGSEHLWRQHTGIYRQRDAHQTAAI